jgi:hypothetical protein
VASRSGNAPRGRTCAVSVGEEQSERTRSKRALCFTQPLPCSVGEEQSERTRSKASALLHSATPVVSSRCSWFIFRVERQLRNARTQARRERGLGPGLERRECPRQRDRESLFAVARDRRRSGHRQRGAIRRSSSTAPLREAWRVSRSIASKGSARKPSSCSVSVQARTGSAGTHSDSQFGCSHGRIFRFTPLPMKA